MYIPKRRLAGPQNLILFSIYAFSYDGSIENSLQSDKILFSDQAIATMVYDFQNFSKWGSRTNFKIEPKTKALRNQAVVCLLGL